MRYNRSALGSAGTALAAVLVLAPVSAMAQVAGPAVAPQQQPSGTAEPAIAQPPDLPGVNSGSPPVNSGVPSTVFGPSSPVVQPVPAMPQAAPPAAVTAPATDTPPANRNEPASRSDAAAPKKRVSQAEKPIAFGSSVASRETAQNIAPVQAPVVARTIPDTGPAKPAVEASNTHVDAWVLGLGALAFMGGVGVLSLRGRRRGERRFGHQADDGRTVTPVSEAGPAMKEEAGMVDQLAMEERLVVSPETGARPAVSRSAFPQWTQESGSVEARRAALVAAAPSRENPFLTRRNRLRRANFVLRQQEEGKEAGAFAPMAEQAAAQTHAPSPAQSYPQIVYRFSGKALRPPTLKPRSN